MTSTDTMSEPDLRVLGELNLRFIDAWRKGSWELLEPILTPSFGYLEGARGEVWERTRYIDELRSHAEPDLTIDQVAIHVSGDVAAVSARSHRPGGCSRYLDSYVRTEEGWRCYHACVWPLAT
ncbi:MAG: nuclear transport factor 2 family protein [Candidatus Dormibacteraceae bacterium]